MNTETQIIRKCSIPDCPNQIEKRGTILCDACYEKQKSLSLKKKEIDFFRLLERNAILEKKIIELEEKTKENIDSDYCAFMEEENLKLGELVLSLKKEICNLQSKLEQKNFSETQLRLDKERKEIISSLTQPVKQIVKSKSGIPILKRSLTTIE